MNKIKIGISLPITDFNYTSQVAIRAEELGYDSIWYQDHFLKSYRECWTILSALAVLTKKIRLGPLVTCVLYRPPAILAKIISTLDEISNGRVNVGLGAGWWEREFLAYGIPFDPPKVRVDKFKEALEIMKLLWTKEERFDYKGKYYTIIGAELFPKPVQKPYPPIYIGAFKPRMLKITAREANGWIPDIGNVERYKEAMNIIKKNLKRPIEEFEFGVVIKLCLANDFNEAIERYGDYLKQRYKRPLHELKKLPFARFVGGPDELIRRIERCMKLGITYIVLLFEPEYDALRMVELSSDVIKYFK